VIDFQAPLSHTLISDNKKKKGGWDKMFLDGRPPLNVGVTSGGNFFGGTAISFTDVLGDRRVDAYIASMSQYRTFGVSMINLEHRLNYAIQGYWQDEFYYGGTGGVYYDPIYSPYIDRDLATSTRTNRGASAFGIYPLDRYRRMEVSGGFGYIREQYNDPVLEELAKEYQEQLYGNSLYRNGWYTPLSVTFVQETTIFREFGPLSGNTMRVMYEVAPPLGGKTLSWQTVDLDLRKYFKVGSSALLALRGRGFRSWGGTPSFTYFGGNADMRGYDYLQFSGQNAVYGNAEFRMPLIDAMATPIGVLGGIRGVAYFNVGGAWWDNTGYTFGTNKDSLVTPLIGVDFDPITGGQFPVYGDPVAITGLRLVDGRASYGIGLETFALGFPIHFDWSWRTLFNDRWEEAVFGTLGAEAWKRARFQFWIGYDF
jgi:outer membrane protein assembly factor BamA